MLNAQLTASTIDSSTEFDVLLGKYAEMAKSVLRRKMKPDEESELVKKATSIAAFLKNKYLGESLQSSSFTLKYLDETDFPNFSKHVNNNKTDSRIVEFVVAFYEIYKRLTKELIAKIVKKSPLEMICLLKEFNVFLQFMSAKPGNFGFFDFSTKGKEATTIYVTNETTLCIMGLLIFKNLNTGGKVYKLSGLASALSAKCQEFKKNSKAYSKESVDEIFKQEISSMKRNIANDARVAIYVSGVKR
jgi:hypothetical protein